MFRGIAIHRLLRDRLQSQTAAFPALSSLISKKEQECFENAATKSSRAFAILGAGVTGLLSFATISSCDEAEHGLECPDYPWPHNGILSSYDHASGVLPREPMASNITVRLPNTEDLDAYALEQWELFLSHLINSSETQKSTNVSSSMMKVFQRGLLSQKVGRKLWTVIVLDKD